MLNEFPKNAANDQSGASEDDTPPDVHDDLMSALDTSDEGDDLAPRTRDAATQYDPPPTRNVRIQVDFRPKQAKPRTWSRGK